jgi:hypothetical protein
MVSSEKDQEFREMTGIQDLNQSLELVLPEGSSISTNESFTLLLFNRSNRLIQFTRDHSVRAFIPMNGGGWIEVPNRMRYLGEGEILAPKGETLSNYVTFVGLQPEYPPMEAPFVLRVFVSGQILEQGEPTGERAGAYIDLEILP